MKTETDLAKERADEIINLVLKTSENEKSFKVPIVNEKMFSVMCDAGSLSNHDSKVLGAVRERLKTLKIKGVKLSEANIPQNHTYTDSDSSSYGLCAHYYIEAEEIIE